MVIMSVRDDNSEAHNAISVDHTLVNNQDERIWALPPLPPLCERDRAHIKGLSPQEVRSWAIKKVVESRHSDSEPYYVYRLRALHNSTLPLYQLPPEIILHVLQFLGRGRSDSKWALAYTAVCRYWRETLFSYPLLWTSIDLGNRDTFNQLCLALSKNADLAIRLHDAASRSVRSSAMRSPYFNNMLAPHSHRIARLDLEPYSLVTLHRSSMLSILDGPMERLTTLTLSSMVDVGHPLHLHLDSRHFPHLEILSLHGVSIDWDDFVLPRLVSLTLAMIYDDPRQPTLDAFLHFLNAAPLLQILSLDGLTFPLSPITSSPFRSLIPLDHLHTFRFLDPSPRCRALIAHLSLPAGVSVTIIGFPFEVPVDGAAVPANVQVFTTVLPTIFKHTVLSQVQSVHLHVWDECLELHADSKSMEYRPRRLRTLRVIFDTAEAMCDAFLPNTLLELPHIFHDALAHLLIESAGLNLVDRHQWKLLFAAFPRLQTLQLYSNVPLSQECFTALRPVEDLPIPCDQLQELGLRCTQGTEEAVSDMLDGLQCCLEDRLQATARLAQLRVTAPLFSIRREEYAVRLGELVTFLKFSSQ